MMDERRHYTAPVTTLSRDDCDAMIRLALEEDAPEGDPTSESIFDKNTISRAVIRTRENGILCGMKFAEYLIEFFIKESGLRLKIEYWMADGSAFKTGEIICEISGPVRGLLRVERPILNFLQYLSGISTRTAQAVELAGPGISVLDTRKTIPGYRKASKYAVYCGGGTNHRINLSEMAMIKDNHIAAAGSIRSAVEKIRKGHPDLPIEIEVESIEQLKEALTQHPKVILLDNMSVESIRQCAELIRKEPESHRPFIEVSGGWRPDQLHTLHEFAPIGVSMGYLTHTTRFLDFSLEMT